MADTPFRFVKSSWAVLFVLLFSYQSAILSQTASPNDVLEPRAATPGQTLQQLPKELPAPKPSGWSLAGG
ncbi:MAG: hypothetical protein RL397_1021 [Pseudomonadota bacterium]|jgi:hypothetical protein